MKNAALGIIKLMEVENTLKFIYAMFLEDRRK